MARRKAWPCPRVEQNNKRPGSRPAALYPSGPWCEAEALRDRASISDSGGQEEELRPGGLGPEVTQQDHTAVGLIINRPPIADVTRCTSSPIWRGVLTARPQSRP